MLSLWEKPNNFINTTNISQTLLCSRHSAMTFIFIFSLHLDEKHSGLLSKGFHSIKMAFQIGSHLEIVLWLTDVSY